MIDRSASAATVVEAVSELFAGFASTDVVVTVAVLESVPPVAGAVTVIVIAGPVPGSRFARVHVTVPDDWLQLQPVPDAETNATPSGRVSVTVSPVAVCGPPFTTLSV